MSGQSFREGASIPGANITHIDTFDVVHDQHSRGDYIPEDDPEIARISALLDAAAGQVSAYEHTKSDGTVIDHVCAREHGLLPEFYVADPEDEFVGISRYQARSAALHRFMELVLGADK